MDFLLLGLGALAGLGVGLLFSRREELPTASALRSAEQQGPGSSPVELDTRLLDFLGSRLLEPLSEMVESAEMLQEDAVLLEQNDFVPDLIKIRTTAAQALALLQDLHELGQLHHAPATVAAEPVALRSLVASVQADVQALLYRTLATLSITVESTIPPLYTDERRLRRALVNLVVQAVAMSPQGALQLTVRGEGDSVLFVLDHSELALSSEQRDQLLYPPGPAQSSARCTVADEGLGWVLTASIIRWLGGELEASPLKAGTRVVLRLPVGAPVEPA